MWQIDENRFVARVWETNLGKLKEFVAPMEKLSAKLGLAVAPSVEVVHREEFRVESEDAGFEVFVRLWVEVVSCPLKLADWRLAGLLEHTSEGNVLRMVDRSLQAPQEYRSRAPICDHCGTTRRRKDTFLVYNDRTEEWKQVGSSCLADFTGHPQASVYAEMCDRAFAFDAWLGDAEKETKEEAYKDAATGEPKQRRFISLERFLSYVCLSIRIHGWVSKAEEREEPWLKKTATATEAIDLWSAAKYEKRHGGTPLLPNDQDCEEAKDAISWASELPEEKRQNDYMSNLHTLAKAGVLEFRDLPLAASMVAVFQRERTRKKEEELVSRSPKYIGTEGAREEFVFTVLFTSLVGEEQPCLMHRMVDQEGNPAIWFASGSTALVKGHTYRVKATVKAHEVYRGKMQTRVTRIQVLEDLT
jgi:hypothetical protein